MFSPARLLLRTWLRAGGLSFLAVQAVSMIRAVPILIRKFCVAGIPVLGICYGHQLLAHHLGGKVERGALGEYGLANLNVTVDDPLLRGVSQSQIWMSHRDTVADVPSGFQIIASTETSGTAAMSDGSRRLYGLQFHPEVVHTHAGKRILENFVFGVCGAQSDWDVAQRVPLVEDQIRAAAKYRNVFFFR